MTTAPNAAKPWPRSGVHRLPGEAGWMVPSRTTPGAFWHVTWEHRPGRRSTICFRCTCPAGVERGQMGTRDSAGCRHVRAVVLAEQDDGYEPRPTPPVNVSALVD